MTSLHTTVKVRRSSSWLVALALLAMGVQMAHAETSPRCRQWLDRLVQNPNRVQVEQPASGVVPKTGVVSFPSDPWDIASIADVEKLEAMQCLLGAENDSRPAAFSGAVRLDVSQTFAPVQVNLAALYAISYIYTGHYDHAAAVALRGDNASSTDSRGNYVTKARAVRRAYAAYRGWFEKVRQQGLANARNAGLQPLQGSGLSWY